MKFNIQSGATDKITRGAEKKIAKPKKDEKVTRKAVERLSEKLKKEKWVGDARALLHAQKKELDNMTERLNEFDRSLQQLRQEIVAFRAAHAVVHRPARPAPAA